MKPGLIGSGPHIRHWRRSEFIFAVHPRTWTRRRGRESGLSEGNHDRPAVKFGPDDAFLTNLVKLLRVLPVFPMFGRGETKLQPVYVEDVAEAVTRLIANKGATRQPIYELGGPQIFTYEELLRTIAQHIGAHTKFMPMPFALWHVLGWISEHVPGAPLTRNQIELMEQDTAASPELPGLRELAIEPTAIEPPWC